MTEQEQRQYDEAIAARDAAIAERDGLTTERDAAIAERDGLTTERDAAIAERDAIKNEYTKKFGQQGGKDEKVEEEEQAVLDYFKKII